MAKRLEQRFLDFRHALKRLAAVLEQDLSLTDAIIDATIQRFEFVFELSWKLAKDILGYRGILANSPRSVIKEAFQQEIIVDGDAWISMLEDRNMAAHIYDEEHALRIYNEIKDTYYTLFCRFESKVAEIIEEMQEG